MIKNKIKLKNISKYGNCHRIIIKLIIKKHSIFFLTNIKYIYYNIFTHIYNNILLIIV